MAGSSGWPLIASKSMKTEEQESGKDALIAEIQRRISLLVTTDRYTEEEKTAIARRFFQALEEE